MDKLNLTFNSGDILQASSLNLMSTKVDALVEDIDKKYVKASTGIPLSDLASSIQTSLEKADSALQSYTEKYTGTYSKPSGGIPKTDLAQDVQTSLGKADTALQSYTEQYTGTYSKPSGGIPKTDLAQAVQTSLEKADTALQSYTEQYTGTYSKPSGGIPKTDLAQAVQTSLGKADTALQSYTEQYTGTYDKPSTGIPKTDLASDVQTSLGKADSAIQKLKTINNLSLIGDGNITITGGSSGGTTVTSLSELNDDETHRLVTDTEKNTWNSKQDAISNLSTIESNASNGNTAYGYFTNGKLPYSSLSGTPTIPAAQVQTDWNATTGMGVLLNKPTIPSTLSDLTDDTTHRLVTDTEKSTWNGKQDTISNLSTIESNASNGNTAYGYFTSGKLPYSSISGTPTIPTKLSDLTDDATHRIVTDTEKSTWNGKQDAISNLSTIESNASNGNTAYGYFTSGKLPYSSLSGTPTIPAAQVQSDWDATSGMGVILNKPIIPSTLASLTDDSTHRLVTDTEKSTWNGKQDAISNLGTIESNASNGNTAYGYFTSGKLPYTSISGTPTIPTVTDTYSSTSTNAMSGKAVASAISGVNQVPSYSTSNNGMVLCVVNGTLTWKSVATVYSGTSTPSDSLGTDGDIYIQG